MGLFCFGRKRSEKKASNTIKKQLWQEIVWICLIWVIMFVVERADMILSHFSPIIWRTLFITSIIWLGMWSLQQIIWTPNEIPFNAQHFRAAHLNDVQKVWKCLSELVCADLMLQCSIHNTHTSVLSFLSMFKFYEVTKRTRNEYSDSNAFYHCYSH